MIPERALDYRGHITALLILLLFGGRLADRATFSFLLEVVGDPAIAHLLQAHLLGKLDDLLLLRSPLIHLLNELFELLN